jgi:hypothetical protein
MKILGLYRKMESLYRLRAMVDGTNRERWMAESKKWRERAELEIRVVSSSALWNSRCDRALARYDDCASRQVKLTAVLR